MHAFSRRECHSKQTAKEVTRTSLVYRDDRGRRGKRSPVVVVPLTKTRMYNSAPHETLETYDGGFARERVSSSTRIWPNETRFDGDNTWCSFTLPEVYPGKQSGQRSRVGGKRKYCSTKIRFVRVGCATRERFYVCVFLYMCVYVHIYVCVCMYIYICVCVLRLKCTWLADRKSSWNEFRKILSGEWTTTRGAAVATSDEILSRSFSIQKLFDTLKTCKEYIKYVTLVITTCPRWMSFLVSVDGKLRSVLGL